MPRSKWPSQWNPNHKFIFGNHQNPEESIQHPNCLGKSGFLEKQNIYFVSGAWSIDYKNRTPYIDWWPNEELSYLELINLIEDIPKRKPKIIVTHDCPDNIKERLFGYKFVPTKTGGALSDIFNAYHPEIWISGHHHRAKQAFIEGTNFISLSELECFELPEIKW